MKGEKKIKKIKNWDPCPYPHQCLLRSLWSRLNKHPPVAGFSPYSLLLSSHLGKPSKKTPGKTIGKMSKKFNLMRRRVGKEWTHLCSVKGKKSVVETLVCLVIVWWQKTLHQKAWKVTVVQRHCLALHWFTSLSTGKVISFPFTETAIPG